MRGRCPSEEIGKRLERESPRRSVIRHIHRRLRMSPRCLPTRAREGESNKPDVPWARRKKGGASMSKKKSSLAGLQALFARVCGLDVHKKLVVACVRILDSKDGTVQSTLRKFGTMTADLLELRQWLVELKVTHVAMESTGVYWQPVFNLLEGHFKVWVVNAQHIKKVPGRKTDMKDAEWIAQLLAWGVLGARFVPVREARAPFATARRAMAPATSAVRSDVASDVMG